MKKCPVLWLAVFAFVISLTHTVHAAIPQTMAFQGRLTSTSGQALDGSFTVTFRIFDAAGGGTKLWEETKTLTVSTGLFSTFLGSATPLTLSFDQPYWVEIQVGTELLSPRQPLAASPYTFRAQQVDGINVVGGSVGIGTATPDSKLTVQGDSTAPYLLNVGGSSNGRLKVRHIDGKDHRNGNTSDLFLQYGINANTFMNIGSSGGVGIGTATLNNYKLNVNGPAYATGGWQGSSIALKTDIHPLSSQEEQTLLTKLANLPLYRYRLKNPDGLKSTHLGVLAEETMSELVDEKRKAVSYGDTLAVLMAGVKAQQKEIESLRAEINKLKSKPRK